MAPLNEGGVGGENKGRGKSQKAAALKTVKDGVVLVLGHVSPASHGVGRTAIGIGFSKKMLAVLMGNDFNVDRFCDSVHLLPTK